MFSHLKVIQSFHSFPLRLLQFHHRHLECHLYYHPFVSDYNIPLCLPEMFQPYLNIFVQIDQYILHMLFFSSIFYIRITVFYCFLLLHFITPVFCYICTIIYSFFIISLSFCLVKYFHYQNNKNTDQFIRFSLIFGVGIFEYTTSLLSFILITLPS